MTVSTIKMTARQFLELGEDPPGVRLELVDGEIAVSPSPLPKHGYLVLKLAHILISHVEKFQLGRVYPDIDTIFGEFDVRRPDLLFFQTSRLHLIGKKAMEGPPDLCVEVISPSSGKIDRDEKFEQYQNGGVASYWIVDPAKKTFEAFALNAGVYVAAARASGNESVSAPPFKSLVIPLGELWQPE